MTTEQTPARTRRARVLLVLVLGLVALATLVLAWRLQSVASPRPAAPDSDILSAEARIAIGDGDLDQLRRHLDTESQPELDAAMFESVLQRDVSLAAWLFERGASVTYFRSNMFVRAMSVLPGDTTSPQAMVEWLAMAGADPCEVAIVASFVLSGQAVSQEVERLAQIHGVVLPGQLAAGLALC